MIGTDSMPADLVFPEELHPGEEYWISLDCSERADLAGRRVTLLWIEGGHTAVVAYDRERMHRVSKMWLAKPSAQLHGQDTDESKSR